MNEIKPFIKRELFEDLKKHLLKKEITLIAGPRQAGKTTLMMLLKKHLELSSKKTVFLSFDFENDQKFFSSQNSLVEKLKLEFGNSEGYVFIDEVQRKEDAGVFLKGIYDIALPYKFIVSGSGSVELKEKIHESLAGRKAMFEIFPVSFSEFVNFKTEYKYSDRLDNYFAVENKKTVELLAEYLNFGGYPRVVTEDTLEEKTRIISEIYGSYMEKDIAYLLKIEKLEAFSSLVKILAGQTGRMVNYSELSNTIGISAVTVRNYLWYLEKTFITEAISPYFKNARKEITKSPVIYFHDIGFRNYSLGLFGRAAETGGSGFIFQNFIFNVLKINFLFSGVKINYWRTKEKAEVDFVASSGDKLIPIEVKYADIKKPEINRSLRSFIEKYSPEKAFIVNKNFKGSLNVGKTEINFIPFWELIGKDIFNP